MYDSDLYVLCLHQVRFFSQIWLKWDRRATDYAIRSYTKSLRVMIRLLWLVDLLVDSRKARSLILVFVLASIDCSGCRVHSNSSKDSISLISFTTKMDPWASHFFISDFSSLNFLPYPFYMGKLSKYHSRSYLRFYSLIQESSFSVCLLG